MRNKLLILSTLLSVLAFACGESKDVSKAQESYLLIYGSFLYTKESQQVFIDKAAIALNSIKYDNNSKIDTKELRLLLDSARSASQTRLLIIKAAKEFDDEIKYKEKVLNYVNLLNDLYAKEFEEFISILESSVGNRHEISSRLLLSRLEELDRVGQECQKAGEEVISKYEIDVENITIDSL